MVFSVFLSSLPMPSKGLNWCLCGKRELLRCTVCNQRNRCLSCTCIPAVKLGMRLAGLSVKNRRMTREKTVSLCPLCNTRDSGTVHLYLIQCPEWNLAAGVSGRSLLLCGMPRQLDSMPQSLRPVVRKGTCLQPDIRLSCVNPSPQSQVYITGHAPDAEATYPVPSFKKSRKSSG